MKAAALMLLLALTGTAHAACTPDQATRQLVEQTARMHGLPPFMLTALVQRESGFCANAVSRTGAIGYGQLMPDTARSLGVDPLNPNENIWGAAKYLRQQWDTFKDWRLALAAYNAGPGAVIKHGGVPPYQETQAYVRNVLGTYNVLSGQRRAMSPVQVPLPILAALKPTTTSPTPILPILRLPTQAASAAIVRAPSPMPAGVTSTNVAKPTTPASASVSQGLAAGTSGLLILRRSAPGLSTPTADQRWNGQTALPADSMLVYRALAPSTTAPPDPLPSPTPLADVRP